MSGEDLSKALQVLPHITKALINQTDGNKRTLDTAPSPTSRDAGALARLGTCYRILDGQSVGIRKPALLNAVRLRQARNRCRAALRRAPGLAEAEAGLAMVDALEGDAEAAKARLTRIKDHPGFLAYYEIARFWVLAKHFTTQQAIDSLETAVKKNPGFLLGRGYLGEALSVSGRHKEALGAFQAYLDAVPNQPFVMTRIGHELAKLDRHAEAIRITREALDLDPTNAETRLERGSRFIDAGRFGDAIEALDALASEPGSRGEVHLRLGYAYLKTGRMAEAVVSFKNAIARATAPTEWRTRGRAHYDLAKAYGRLGDREQSFAALREAVDSGFQSPKRFQTDPDLEELRK